VQEKTYTDSIVGLESSYFFASAICSVLDGKRNRKQQTNTHEYFMFSTDFWLFVLLFFFVSFLFIVAYKTGVYTH
jgi:hypothetical protein